MYINQLASRTGTCVSHVTSGKLVLIHVISVKKRIVCASIVNIDYILDERLRELYPEEFRVVTLARLGKLYDRDKLYNPKSGLSIEQYHNLWPIPSNEITQNTEAKLEQNPGYN
ncbi:RagB/SusD family nutrient uptake outer membrane protein [Sphingobacterium spiritivorum]|uniref:RagB/SusD family nutrient uptake outer membrane protein n=1 Tax=Sphingobacterium spiritivorum TaxID=258 RepID=UPI003DA4C118